MKPLTVFFILCFLPLACLAQDDTVDSLIGTPEPVPEVTPTPTHDEEPILWDLELAERGFAINKNPLNFSRVVNAYEKLIAFHCFGSLFKTLEHAPDKNSPRCGELIDKLLSIYPLDPVAICAQKGIDSEPCALSYKNIKILEDNQAAISPTAELNEKLLEGQTKEKITALENDLYNLQNANAANPQENAKKTQNILSVLLQLMRIGCKGNTISLQTNDYYQGSNKPFPPPESFTRNLLIARNCMSYIERALTFDPGFPPAICTKNGDYSPACVQAWRVKRKFSLPQQPAKARPAGPQDPSKPARPPVKKAPHVKEELQQF
jgi:hypothetical protein